MKRIVAIVAAVASVGFPAGARAACNVIPDTQDQLVNAQDRNAEAQALVQAVEAEEKRFDGLRYKGALGRIDRMFLGPQRTDAVRVAADGVCVSARDHRPFTLADTGGLVAALIARDQAGRAQTAVAVAETTACRAFDQAATKERLQIAGCKGGGIATVAGHPQVVEIAFPAHPPIQAPRAARIVLFRADSAAAAEAALTAARDATDCAALCKDAAADALGACIDDLYAPTGLTAANAVVYGTGDLVKCELMETPTPIPWNDFKEECDDGPGSTGLPPCKNNPNKLTFWEDGCHGIYVPFDWKSIRFVDPNDPNSKVFDREVRGQTALSLRGEAEGGRVWIPGREYVGTLLEEDVTGTGSGFVSDPRNARIGLRYPTKEEFGLEGVTDKNNSIVHVVPRLPVTRLCDRPDAEACTGVPTDPDDDATRCACTDKYPADCACVTVSKGKLFQCSDTGMPCTRHQHCNPNGLCKAQPKCMAAGTVWGSTAAMGANCWDDSHCTDPTVPGYDANKPQCGYLLFDVRQKRETNKSEVVMKAKLTAAGKKRRGVCKLTGPANRVPCSNVSGPPTCTAAQGDCTEYVLEALGGTEVVP